MHSGIRRAFSLRSKGFVDRHVDVGLRAMAEGCDSIILLTDGSPSTDDFVVIDKDYGDRVFVADLETKRRIAPPKRTIHHGPMDETEWLLDDIRRMNLFRKLQIQCITIGEADVDLMRVMAAENGGELFQIGKR